ncbi:NAD(P)/FAD-dependent oxidoreductase [Sphingomonas liriopis]|uniref:FAD-dependent oxidoreductase n=1 Tax=Sphingomonas liriopis TaxID=2949094 RepID=UPI0030F3821A
MAVAGCGPAGLAAALLLARDGHRVTIVERFDAPAPIGSGLMIQPTGLAVLRALGLEATLVARSARIDRLFGQANGRTVLDVAYATLGQAGLCGFGVHRATLFAVLHDAVTAAGIPIETGRAIAGSDMTSGNRRCLVFADGARSAPFDLIVDALGTRTPLAPPCGRELGYGAVWASLRAVPGFAGDALEQRYRRASTMAGVLPIGRSPGAEADQAAFFWSIRADRVAAWRDAGLDAWKDEVRALWPATTPLLDQIAERDQLTFARYAHRTLPTPVGPAMIHIGDAWHSASPQLGQGANMALLDAYALAKGLRESDDVAAGLAAAVALRRRHVRLYQALTALFTPVYQSDSRLLPFVRDRLVGPLSGLWPANRIQAAMVSGLIGSPLAPLALASSGFVR